MGRILTRVSDWQRPTADLQRRICNTMNSGINVSFCKTMITMADIAVKAGVSRSAVSLVLNGKTSVHIADSTRQRILETAVELGYRTNQLARSVASGKTKMIGYLVNEPNYEPHWNTVVGALSEAEKLGYTLKVMSVTGETLEERVRQCVELRLSGLIVRIFGDRTRLYEEANLAKLPLVLVDESIEQPFGTRVAADDAAGIGRALDHLTALGHSRIGFISSGFPRFHRGNGDSADIGTARERLFVRAMCERGLPLPANYIAHEIMAVFGSAAEAPDNISTAIAATRELLAHPAGRPTAILCWRDETAMVAIGACRAAGLRVPQDISVVGFSDVQNARFFDPPLSTVKSPWNEMGCVAIQQICQGTFEELSLHSRAHFIATGFVARQSTGPAPADG